MLGRGHLKGATIACFSSAGSVVLSCQFLKHTFIMVLKMTFNMALSILFK